MKLGLPTFATNVKPKYEIPLPIVSNMANDKFGDEVKIKLRRNPASATSERYTKTFKIWNGSSVEGYCRTRNNLKEIIERLPITTKAELRIHAVNILGQVNQDNLVTVINSAPNNASIEQYL